MTCRSRRGPPIWAIFGGAALVAVLLDVASRLLSLPAKRRRRPMTPLGQPLRPSGTRRLAWCKDLSRSRTSATWPARNKLLQRSHCLACSSVARAEPLAIGGTSRAQCSTTAMSRRPEFVFNRDFQFPGRWRAEDGYFRAGDKRSGGLTNYWETNFIPAWSECCSTRATSRGRRSGSPSSRWPATRSSGRYQTGRWAATTRPNYHGPGAVLLVLRSECCVLIWPKGGWGAAVRERALAGGGWGRRHASRHLSREHGREDFGVIADRPQDHVTRLEPEQGKR